MHSKEPYKRNALFPTHVCRIAQTFTGLFAVYFLPHVIGLFCRHIDFNCVRLWTLQAVCSIIIIIIIIISATALLLGASSPYTSTDKTNKNKYT